MTTSCAGCGMPFDHRQYRARHCSNPACTWCVACVRPVDAALNDHAQTGLCTGNTSNEGETT